MPLPQLLGQSRRVRRDENVVQVPEWRVRGKWLFLEYVESSAADPAIAQHFRQCPLVDQGPSSHVDEISVTLHLRETSRIDEPPRLRSQGRCQHDEIRLREKALKLLRRKHMIDAFGPRQLRMFSQGHHYHAQG